MNQLDKVREFWNSRPCNIRHSKSPIGTKEYFDEVEARRYRNEPHGYMFADFPKWQGKKVLEIGCGIGTDAVSFARAGANYTGIDLSSESVNLAKQRFEVFGLTGDLRTVNAEEMSNEFPDTKFDLIWSFGVIHHSPNPRQIILEAQKLMHDSSELRIMLYAKNSWKNIMINAELDQPEAQFGCPIAFTYTDDEVRELLSGFSYIDIKQDFIFPWKVEDYVQYRYVKQPWFESMPDTMFKALEKSLGWHLMITARL